MTEAQLGDAVAEEFARRVTISIDPDCEARFPAETVVRVTVHARGQRFVSPVTPPRGEATSPPVWEERLEKFRMATTAGSSVAARDQWSTSFADLREGRLQKLRCILASVRRASMMPRPPANR